MPEKKEGVTAATHISSIGITMSKRKGMSADDKRRVILKIYHDRKEPFNLKEIETIASKLVRYESAINMYFPHS